MVKIKISYVLSLLFITSFSQASSTSSSSDRSGYAFNTNRVEVTLSYFCKNGEVDVDRDILDPDGRINYKTGSIDLRPLGADKAGANFTTSRSRDFNVDKYGRLYTGLKSSNKIFLGTLDKKFSKSRLSESQKRKCEESMVNYGQFKHIGRFNHTITLNSGVRLIVPEPSEDSFKCVDRKAFKGGVEKFSFPFVIYDEISDNVLFDGKFKTNFGGKRITCEKGKAIVEGVIGAIFSPITFPIGVLYCLFGGCYYGTGS